MKQYILLILSFLMAGRMLAEDEQVLVFRNTGEVNLFYTNTLDSVTSSCIDAEGVLHGEPVSQVFWSKDTVMAIPLAEIDSVAIGDRNVMEFQEDVKQLTMVADLPWIIRFDGQSIFYRTDTPSSILPREGMKLFYGLDGEEDSVFPYGLCAKVTNVMTVAGEIRVDIESVALDEIFSRLFLAGRVQTEMNAQSSGRRAPQIDIPPVTLSVNSGLALDGMGSINVKGEVKVSGNVIFSTEYRHADLTMSYGYGVGLSLEAKENATCHVNKLGPKTKIGTIWGLLNLEAAVGAFADVTAEMNLDMGIERTYTRKMSWTHQGEEDHFEMFNVSGDESSEDKAHVDLTLDGSVLFGPMMEVDFATIGSLVGARAKVKAGTEVTGHLSMGMLRNMRNYTSQAYANGELSFYGKAALEGYLTNRRLLAWNEVEEHKIFDTSLTFGGHTMRLFPEYTQRSATAATQQTKEVKVSVAAAVEETPPTDIETGFEIVDPQGEVVDSVFNGTIEAETENQEVQTFDSEITMPETVKADDMDGYTMRPVFHYAGFTISAAPVGIRKDVLLQPYSFGQSNGAATFVSSGPFIGSTVIDSTLYIVGTYLPVPLKNNIFKSKGTSSSSSLPVGKQIDGNAAAELVGTWKGMLDGEEVTLAFDADGTGTLNNEEHFDYLLNNPQSGDLLLLFEDGETKVYAVLSVTYDALTIINKRDKSRTRYVLNRIS